MKQTSCPALLLTAPASGQGKTTLTAALARHLTQRGKKVRVFKTGPDYLDPQILQQASGYPVEQLDLWMCGEAYCRQRLWLTAQDADLILIEGVMGMFDGDPSSADLATLFNIPVGIIMDVSAMAQTAAALACGLANFRQDITVAGLIANHCASPRHRELIENALPENLPLLFSVAKQPEIALPERHLGLIQASEITDELELRLNKAAQLFDSTEMDRLLDSLPPALFHHQETPELPASLAGLSIAIARDSAFSFIYQANIDLLQQQGAEVIFFSPLSDQQMPEADALWLPGGYPELYAKELAANTSMLTSIQRFKASNKPILAECGGFLYCLENIKLLSGEQHSMTALLPGHAEMRERGGCQGMQSAPLPEGEIRGHSHHRSQSDCSANIIDYGKRAKHPAPGEAIYREGSLTASYLHLFFPSNPEAIGKLFSGINAL